jgi:anaerobic sulfite reductase subunit A
MSQPTGVTAADLELLMLNRGNMYGLLARLYREEADEALLRRLLAMDTSADSTPEITAPLRELQASIAHPMVAATTELALEYARIFLGAGGQDSAFPFESVYSTPERLLMQEARDRVLEQYRQEGLDRATHFHEPEDHIALELEFMAYLCQQAALAFNNEHRPTATHYLAKQKSFLEQHLLRWVPEFCHDVTRLAQLDFYRAGARITVSFLRMEEDILGKLVH